jgi:hypothetical protein
VGIIGILAILATRMHEPEVNAPRSGSDVGMAVTPDEPRADEALTLTSVAKRTGVAPEGEQPTEESDASSIWRVRVLDGRTSSVMIGATVSVLDLGTITRELDGHGIGFDTLEGKRVRRARAIEARTTPSWALADERERLRRPCASSPTSCPSPSPRTCLLRSPSRTGTSPRIRT